MLKLGQWIPSITTGKDQSGWWHCSGDNRRSFRLTFEGGERNGRTSLAAFCQFHDRWIGNHTMVLTCPKTCKRMRFCLQGNPLCSGGLFSGQAGRHHTTHWKVFRFTLPMDALKSQCSDRYLPFRTSRPVRISFPSFSSVIFSTSCSDLSRIFLIGCHSLYTHQL